MEINSLIDPYALHYDTFAGDVYTLATAGITLTAGEFNGAIGGTTPAPGTFSSLGVYGGVLPQVKIGYDTDNYLSVHVSSGGNITLIATGGNIGFSDTALDINAGAIDNTVIGGSTPAAGSFTTLVVDTDTLVVNASGYAGKVGIGTTAPDSIFHIKANFPGIVGSDYAGQLIIQDPDDSVYGNAVITGYESDGDGNPDQQLWYLGSSSINDSNIIFLNRRNSKLQLGTNGVSHLTILGNGNVGIGVTDPDTKLEIFNAGNQLKLSFDGTDNTIFAVDTSGDLTITPSGTGITIAGTLGAGAITGAAGSFTTLAASAAATFDTTVVVNAGNAAQNYLTIEGSGPPTPLASRIGGGIELWPFGAITGAGYIYYSFNSRIVFGSAKQATYDDYGFAWIETDSGAASFAGGDLTVSSTGNLVCGNINLDEILVLWGASGDDATFLMWGDHGEDDIDKWKLLAADGGLLSFQNRVSGAYVSQMTMTPADPMSSAIFGITGISKFGDGTNELQISATGDLTFHGTGGLAFAEIYVADASDTITIAVTGKANKVQITSFTANGVSNNCTPDHTNDHITITTEGIYKCNMSMHFLSGGTGGADNYGYSVYKNNGATEFTNLHGQRDLAGGGGDEGSISVCGLIDLAAPVANTDTSYAFVDSDPDTLTDSNNQFVADGFLVGQTLTISGSTSNDGDYTIAVVAAGTITLIAADTLTAEDAGDTVTLTGTNTVEVWIWNNTNDDDVVIDDINLNLIQIGGT